MSKVDYSNLTGQEIKDLVCSKLTVEQLYDLVDNWDSEFFTNEDMLENLVQLGVIEEEQEEFTDDNIEVIQGMDTELLEKIIVEYARVNEYVEQYDDTECSLIEYLGRIGNNVEVRNINMLMSMYDFTVGSTEYTVVKEVDLAGMEDEYYLHSAIRVEYSEGIEVLVSIEDVREEYEKR